MTERQPEVQTILLRCDPHDSGELVDVEPLGNGMYRALSTQLLPCVDYDVPLDEELDEEPIRYGDHIKTEIQNDGSHVLITHTKDTSFHHRGWLLPRHSPATFREYVDLVEEVGGGWELLFGGWLMVHIPVQSDFDEVAELEERFG